MKEDSSNELNPNEKIPSTSLLKSLLKNSDLNLVYFISFIASMITLFAAITGNYENDFYKMLRDLVVLVILLLAIFIFYRKYYRERIKHLDERQELDSKLNELYGNVYELSERYHDIVHLLRNSICMLYTSCDEYFREKINYLENLFEKNNWDKEKNLEDLINCQINADKILEYYPELEESIHELVDKQKELDQKLLERINKNQYQFYQGITSLMKKQLENSLKVMGYEEKVAISIKAFEDRPIRNKVGLSGLSELYVSTFFRDPETYREQKRSFSTKCCVGDNTGYSKCFTGDHIQKWSYVENNLQEKQKNGEYRHHNGKFIYFYNSIIIVAIQDNTPKEGTVYGFLQADCQNKTGGIVFNENNHLSIVSHGADAIAVYMTVLDSITNITELTSQN